MQTNKLSEVWTVLIVVCVVAALFAPPLVAGRVGIGDENQHDPKCDPKDDDNCSGNTGSGPNGDPTRCTTDPDTTGPDVAHCIQTSVENTGGWADFQLGGGPAAVDMFANPGSGPQPPADPVELDSYCLREDTDVIQFVDIEIDRPNLVAKISKFVEGPTSEGTITIKINHTGLIPVAGFDTVIVDTANVAGHAERLNWRVCNALKAAGLTVDCLERFFVVHADRNHKSPRHVSVLVDDRELETLEIGLEPTAGYRDITACSVAVPLVTPLQR